MTRRQILAALAGAGTSAAAPKPLIEKIDLFEADTEGYSRYRIPGVVVTKRGTVLAYCEARRHPSGDWGATDIMLRRSEDGGRTWGTRQKIAEVPGPHRKNPAAGAQSLGSEGEVLYNNPVAIADRNGSVHFLFCYEYMRAFHMRSDDDGRSFSAPVEITSAFDSLKGLYPFKVLAIGPGHGIQLRNGRLLATVWISPATGGHAHRPSVTSTIYSDDHGQTWHAGDIAVPDTPETAIPNETAAAELSNGRVMLNVRSESARHRRIVVESEDGATKWTPPRFDEELYEPICFGSLVSLGRKRLAFSNPNSTGRERRNLTIRRSNDDGRTWAVAKPLEEGPSAYSDLAVAKDGTLLCLYERGPYRKLTMARIRPGWLTSGS